MNRLFFVLLAFAASCHYAAKEDLLSLIQIQDRNGLTETVSNPERLVNYEAVDFLSSQPYKKVLRIYKGDGKNRSKITTYHPNGMICQYLEAEEMRAHGAYREWFPNGQLKLEAKVTGGTADLALGTQEDWIFDGLSQVWDEQGHLIAVIPYQKGSLEGKSIYSYPSGEIEQELPFEKNKLEGEALDNWPSGALKSKTVYKKGVKEGESLGFFEDGRIAWMEDHSDGRIRRGAYYSPEGSLIAEIEKGSGFQARFEEGALALIEYRIGLPEGMVRKFTPSGELHKIFFIKHGKKEGEEIEYYLASELEESAQQVPKISLHWHENTVHGCVKTWYTNGQLQSQREYSRNQQMGPSLAWYRDGSLMLYEEYEENRLITGQYYKIQKKEPVSSITNGNGLATLFDEAGGFIRKITYLKGKPVAPEE